MRHTLRGAWDIFCELEVLRHYKKMIQSAGRIFLRSAIYCAQQDLPYYILKLDELYEAEPIAKPLTTDLL